MNFPRNADGKESACNAADQDSIPGSRRSPGRGHDNLFQYSCLESPMGRGAWWATVNGVQRLIHDLVTNTLTLEKFVSQNSTLGLQSKNSVPT